MTKKHFLKIAAAFKRQVEFAKNFPADKYRNDAAIDHLENMALDLCDVFKDINQNFDRARFMTACGF